MHAFIELVSSLNQELNDFWTPYNTDHAACQVFFPKSRSLRKKRGPPTRTSLRLQAIQNIGLLVVLIYLDFP